MVKRLRSYFFGSMANSKLLPSQMREFEILNHGPRDLSQYLTHMCLLHNDSILFFGLILVFGKVGVIDLTVAMENKRIIELFTPRDSNGRNQFKL